MLSATRNLACIALALAASACASATLDVVRPVPVPLQSVTLTVRDATRGDVSEEQLDDFIHTISSELRDSGIAVAPAGSSGSASVVGKVLRYDPGIRALRFVTGFGFGTGTIESTWEVRDRRSGETAVCRIDGSVSLGTFGGSIVAVHEEMGKALARFLRGGIH